MQSNFFPGQGIVRAAKPLFAAVVELVETTAANNAAERRNPGKPGFLRSKKWPLTKILFYSSSSGMNLKISSTGFPKTAAISIANFNDGLYFPFSRAPIVSRRTPTFQFVIFAADSEVFLKLFHKIAECLSIM